MNPRKGRRQVQQSKKRTIAIAIPIVVILYFNLLSGSYSTTSPMRLDPTLSTIMQNSPSSYSDKPLQLKVPFYVYTNSSLNWQNVTFTKYDSFPYPEFKHSDDYWMYQAALRHPMRTLDPDAAKLFFAPFLLNAVAERRTCIHIPTGTKCFERPGAALRFAGKCLVESPYFQRSQGRDHVIVMSHWLGPPRRIQNLLQCNIVNFEGVHPNPVNVTSSIPSFYVASPCPTSLQSKKLFDFTFVGTRKDGNPDFVMRKTICDWLNETKFSMSVCGFGDQCPTLSQARYGFHIRGDTWGSQRVVETLMSGTIPLFTNERQYDVLPPFVPWRDVSYLVNVSTREAFVQSLNEILALPESVYKEKMKIVDDYRYLLDHTQIYQFDAYMAEFARRLEIS
eukprot:Nitzschia sp. Nitz4//scaffold117_size69655//64527//65705//NITZ4_006032-RA/size69655-processed-gene-0.94-mRNA-1//1//CDS//3329533675//9020//frame0